MPLFEILAFLLTGAISGLLAGLFGVGGGIVMVPALILVFSEAGMGGDWMPHLAIGTSLATIIGTGLASTYAHHRRRAVRWDLVSKLAAGIVIGAELGAAAAGLVSGIWLERFFAAFLCFVGARMLLPTKGTPTRKPSAGAATLWTAGIGIGMLSSLVGIGGGTLTVPFLSSRGIPMIAAVGTSSACGLPIALAGTVGFMVTGWDRSGLPEYSTGFVYWPAVLLMLLASMPAAPIGVRLAHRLPLAVLKRLFGALLLLVATLLAVR